ncbi:MAG: GIY-YIG nuclease family protein [Bacteroides sp.]|nr:GIY-YIG nuclease family protein [Bacteroides sp.]
MAKTIYTYLDNDDLYGSRIVYMDNCFCKLYSIQRVDFEFLQKFKEELSKPALYILFNKELEKAYIGETDNFLSRIQQHISKKDFWNEALAFMASDDSLSKTEVQFLEYLAYEKASKMRVFDLTENTQTPRAPHMRLEQRGKSEEFFKYVQYLAKFVGCDLFEPNKSKTNNSVTLVKPKVLPVQIKYTSEDLRGTIYMSLNGQGKYNKRKMALEIVKEFLRIFPDTTFEELKATFKRDYLQNYAQYEFIQDDIEAAKKWKELGEDHVHYFVSDNDILVSGDGIRFVVCVEWERNNIINVLGIAQALGWEYEIL